MDIYSFINSRDIAEHCRKIGHKFNASDAAFLVYENKFMDISEKHAAYREIMEKMPDEQITRYIRDYCPEGSFFDNLKRFMDAEKMLLDSLKKQESGTVWNYHIRYIQRISDYDSRAIYSSYEKASADLLNELVKNREERDEPEPREYFLRKCHCVGTISKQWLDTEDCICATLTADNKITKINFYGDEENGNKLNELDHIMMFFDYWVYIPLPFKKGDILCEVYDRDWQCPNPHSNAFTMESICYETMSMSLERRRQSGCSMDMTVVGYFVREDGSVFWDWMHAYHNLEYFRGELKDDHRILKTMSAVMKDEISADLMVYACNTILSDRLSHHVRDSNFFSEVGERDAGLEYKSSE